MIIRIPETPPVNDSGMLAQEWLIFLNEVVRKIHELEEAAKVTP